MMRSPAVPNPAKRHYKVERNGGTRGRKGRLEQNLITFVFSAGYEEHFVFNGL
jgi:hypothetical protein